MGIKGRWSHLLHCPVWRARTIHNMKANECLVWGIFDGSDSLDWFFNVKILTTLITAYEDEKPNYEL